MKQIIFSSQVNSVVHELGYLLAFLALAKFLPPAKE